VDGNRVGFQKGFVLGRGEPPSPRRFG
jgi:hypothetical protein